MFLFVFEDHFFDFRLRKKRCLLSDKYSISIFPPASRKEMRRSKCPFSTRPCQRASFDFFVNSHWNETFILLNSARRLFSCLSRSSGVHEFSVVFLFSSLDNAWRDFIYGLRKLRLSLSVESFVMNINTS